MEAALSDKPGSLEVELGSTSISGIKAINEDSVQFRVPNDPHQLFNKGVCAVIADGVSSAEAGREASEISTSHFIDEYFNTPDTWSVSHAGEKSLSTINLTLFKKSHAFTNEEKGFLCTFSGMVLKSCTAHLFHAGDSRIYQLRNGVLKQLTRDHVANLGNGRVILSRAVGMDNNLQIDYSHFEVEPDDIYLLTTDGIHDFLSDEQLIAELSQPVSAQQMSEQLVEQAKLNQSDDNISCVVLRVINLPKEELDDFNNKLVRLPFPPPLEEGMRIDGFKVECELFASSRSQVYLVVDEQSGEQMVMKTPSVNFQDDIGYIDRFIQEEWIGKRINSPYVARIITQSRPRTFLYYLMEYVEGIGLDKWMELNPQAKPRVAIKLVKGITEALRALHANDTIHQDLKPANVLVDDELNIKVVDFGSVFVAGVAEIFIPLDHQGALGTASYSDPHYLMGKNTSVQGDIYSLATIAYELFTNKLPYGEEIEECRTPLDFDRLRYQHAGESNPLIPIWFDRALEKGTSLDLTYRYTSLDQFIQDLTYPNPDFLRDDPKAPESRGALFWMMMSGFWVLLLIIVLLLFKSN